jgi:hypothetical protein
VATSIDAVPHLNTLTETAAKLRRSKTWLRARMKAGDIEALRLSERSVFVTDDEIIRYLGLHGLRFNGAVVRREADNQFGPDGCAGGILHPAERTTGAEHARRP